MIFMATDLSPETLDAVFSDILRALENVARERYGIVEVNEDALRPIEDDVSLLVSGHCSASRYAIRSISVYARPENDIVNDVAKRPVCVHVSYTGEKYQATCLDPALEPLHLETTCIESDMPDAVRHEAFKLLIHREIAAALNVGASDYENLRATIRKLVNELDVRIGVVRNIMNRRESALHAYQEIVEIVDVLTGFTFSMHIRLFGWWVGVVVAEYAAEVAGLMPDFIETKIPYHHRFRAPKSVDDVGVASIYFLPGNEAYAHMAEVIMSDGGTMKVLVHGSNVMVHTAAPGLLPHVIARRYVPVGVAVSELTIRLRDRGKQIVKMLLGAVRDRKKRAEAEEYIATTYIEAAQSAAEVVAQT